MLTLKRPSRHLSTTLKRQIGRLFVIIDEWVFFYGTETTLILRQESGTVPSLRISLAIDTKFWISSGVKERSMLKEIVSSPFAELRLLFFNPLLHRNNKGKHFLNVIMCLFSPK